MKKVVGFRIDNLFIITTEAKIMAIIKIKDNANNRMLWINTDFINSIEQYENESVTIFSNKYIQSFDEKDGKLFLRYYEEFLRETNSESLREVLQITEAKQ